MTPPSPRRSFSLLAAASLVLSLLSGCDKTADEDEAAPSVRQAEAAPSPLPRAPDRGGRKALSAYNAVSNYLKDEAPDLREHLQKTAARFVKDKDKWSNRLKSRQGELQLKIDHMREQLARTEGRSAEALRGLKQELASLETQNAEAEHKLSQLESVTSDTWKSFRDQFANNDEPAGSPAPGSH